jgi:energy-coupling factor transporter ATP-binding protein EcfA2
MNNMKIKPVPIDESRYNKEELDPFVFPSLSVFIGHVASGKSTLLYNLLELTNPVFKGNVILISPTILNDPIQQKMVEDELILEHYDFFSNELMKHILDAIKEDKDEKYLIVFDDILSMTPKHMTKEGRWWNAYISQYRHRPNEGQVSLMFFLQYYKDLSPVIRSNLSYLGLLGVHSEKHLKQYAEELSAATGGTEESFYEIYEQAKVGKFDFLLLDFRKLRALRNLDTVLYDRDKEFEK